MSDGTMNVKSDVENEFLNIEKGHEWDSFFNAIRDECTQNYNYTSVEAKKAKNKELNRYRDVYPYDHSRIVLSKGPTDYINANLVVVEKAKRKYILTQGPLPQTTSHFWLMIWDQNCRAIVMLNRIIEKNVIKCHQYWPTADSSSDADRSLVFSDVNLKVTNLSEVKDSCYTTTKLRLEDLETGEQREVIHYHCTTWPDFGVPQSPTAFLKFLYAVRESGALENAGPAVVHCSAGIGRSGTFCLVDSCLVMIQDMKLTNIVVRDILMEMRKYRMGLIQTPGQLRFSYLAIIKGMDKTEMENGCSNEDVEEVKDEESEEEAPPLPPPRNESLARSRADSKVKSSGDETNDAEQKTKIESTQNDLVEEKPKLRSKENDIKRKPLEVEEVPRPGETTHTRQEIGILIGNIGIVVGGEPTEQSKWEESTRQRRGRDVKNQILENKIKEMKRKLRESESWRNWKRSLLHPWSIGCLIVGGGIIVYAMLASRV